MSDAQKLIAEVHAAHAMRYDEWATDDDQMFTCLCGVNFPWRYEDPDAEVHPVIETVEQLDALPLNTVVVDAVGIPRTKRHGNSHMPAVLTISLLIGALA